MIKKLAVFTFLSFMGVFFLGLHVFAEGPESPARQICLASLSDISLCDGEFVNWNVVMDGQESELSYSSHPWRTDAITGLASDDADKFDDFNSDDTLDISVVVGLKYFFKSFHLNCLKKSFLSLLSNPHKTGQEPERSLEFFFDLP